MRALAKATLEKQKGTNILFIEFWTCLPPTRSQKWSWSSDECIVERNVETRAIVKRVVELWRILKDGNHNAEICVFMLAKAGQTFMDLSTNHKWKCPPYSGLLKSDVAGESVSSLRSPPLAESTSDPDHTQISLVTEGTPTFHLRKTPKIFYI